MLFDDTQLFNMHYDAKGMWTGRQFGDHSDPVSV
jgi:hypothetical protein